MKLITLLVLGILFLPAVYADLFDSGITDQDRATFDEILTPVMKIYNFLKYAATIVAGLFLIISAIGFMSSGDDQKKRDSTKKSISYVVIGLVVIWSAPYVINFLVA